ncbi:MAG: DUF1080 domain-containing protein [Planctomycetaceae bacterium]
MKTFARLMLVLGIVAASFLAQTQAAEENKNDPKWAALTEKDAGDDFAVQGEYLIKIKSDDAEVKFGVQVIAMGEGKFHLVAYPGGLPGEGWNGKRDELVELDSETLDGVVTFKSDKAMGQIKNSELIVSTLEGQELGRFPRVSRTSPTMSMAPPEGAVVLFDGTTPDNFRGGKITDEKWMEQGVTSFQKFGDCTMHMEFMLSFMPNGRGQGRSNSGVYLQGRYEVQILDSFGLKGLNNECGGLYSVKDPDVNMCYPPLSWQTYDVDYTAARYDNTGAQATNARITVKHNGVVIHNDVELPKGTTGNPVPEGPDLGPFYIQDHSNPLRFRNIWVVAKNKEEVDDDRDYITLFDGQTLNGWHKNPEKIGHGTGGNWQVEDGTITGEQDPPGSGNGGILLTDEKFKDCEVVLDINPDWGVCSGFFVRSTDKGQCIQMMVDYHDRGNVGHIYGEGTGGFNTRPFDIFGIYDENDPKKLIGYKTEPVPEAPPEAYTITGEGWVKIWKLNDWNTVRVRITGNPAHVTTWINGHKINEFNGETFVQKQYDKEMVSQTLGEEGHIAVQVHGGQGWPEGAKCRWRNIRVKRL